MAEPSFLPGEITTFLLSLVMLGRLGLARTLFFSMGSGLFFGFLFFADAGPGPALPEPAPHVAPIPVPVPEPGPLVA